MWITSPACGLLGENRPNQHRGKEEHHEPDDEFLQDVLEVQDDPLVLDINLRRSTRVHKSPSYLKSDHCNQVTSSSFTSRHQPSTAYPLSSFHYSIEKVKFVGE